MGLRVNSNTSSINAQRNLVNTTNNLQRSLSRLSSGLRITRASDDAAGLAISERFRADIRSMGQAQRNANDGISLLQIGEGALNEVSGLLVRQRELAIQAANGTLGDEERATVNQEFQDLTAANAQKTCPRVLGQIFHLGLCNSIEIFNRPHAALYRF